MAPAYISSVQITHRGYIDGSVGVQRTLPSICFLRSVQNFQNVKAKVSSGTSLSSEDITSRRSLILLSVLTALTFPKSSSCEDDTANLINAEKRGSQRGVYIDIQDFAYFTGRYPPRILNFDALPKKEGEKAVYNAFGVCIEDSCQYVPLKQRYDGYNKYQASIRAGTAALEGPLLAAATGAAAEWPAAAEAELVRALRRAVLLANLLLISVNYGTTNEALVARFYVNEAYFALTALAAARRAAAPPPRAAEAWRLARDSWNSYLALVNRAIPAKVGQRFAPVAADA